MDEWRRYDDVSLVLEGKRYNGYIETLNERDLDPEDDEVYGYNPGYFKVVLSNAPCTEISFHFKSTVGQSLRLRTPPVPCVECHEPMTIESDYLCPNCRAKENV